LKFRRQAEDALRKVAIPSIQVGFSILGVAPDATSIPIRSQSLLFRSVFPFSHETVRERKEAMKVAIPSIQVGFSISGCVFHHGVLYNQVAIPSIQVGFSIAKLMVEKAMAEKEVAIPSIQVGFSIGAVGAPPK